MIKVGIVGAGRMGITHYSIINAHPDVQVVAVADPSTLINTLLGKVLKVRTFKDAASMLEKEPLDAVLVCTPPALSYDILKLAHAKGVHAFVEKPFVLSSARGRELAQMFDAKGLVNQVGYVTRFNEIFVRVKRYIDDDVIGKVVTVRNEVLSYTISGEQDDSGWRSSHASGGGVIYEMASHVIDLANYMFGRPDRVGGTSLTKIHSKNVEDAASSTFFYKNGMIGTLYANWCDESYRKPASKLEVFGQNGKMVADRHGLKVFLGKDDVKSGLKKGWNALYFTDLYENVPFYVRGTDFSAQLYHFVEKIQSATDRKTRCSFADASDTAAVIESMFKDAAAVQNGAIA